jgi:hypothetical protein
MAQPYPIHGKIKFKDGTPLKGGMITFTPVEAKTGKHVRYEVNGLVDAQGHFKAGLHGTDAGAAAGEYKVTFKPREDMELRGSNSNRIPAKYRADWETPVTVTVKEGENNFDFTIE